MNIRNCKDCGKLFQYDGISKICYRCRKADDENYKVVKDYVYDNRGASLTEVAEVTEVSEDRILRYLREGRLEIIGDNPGLVLDCERCGKGIRTGRYCESCAQSMEREFKSGYDKPEKKIRRDTDKDRMFITDMKKKR